MKQVGDPDELALLLRLRELRVRTAARHCMLCRHAVEDAQAAVERRQRRIDAWKRRRDDLAQQVVGPAAPAIGRFAASAAALREHLDTELERDEYGLIDDENELDQAQQRLDDAMAQWRRERAREDGVRDLLQQARTEQHQQIELRTDAEAEERAPAPLLARLALEARP
ncbi:hypothetical protein [Ideonella sp. BN130291]|uniref:hypothetical protein n=1 Tax=Ideonella sp. BN130291 TaxID=3112940 RepID=UPI002E268D80|nr:hypothetical protein [Ideonella sp. BN130291]